MESMKKMENIKPAYAVKLGTGLFAGETWIFQCTKCKLVVQKDSQTPPSGSCPNGGAHNWTKTRA